MLLSELYNQLVPSFPPYVHKDMQTAIRILARALDCTSPDHCILERYNRPLPVLNRLLEDYLLAQGKGAHTIRNTKNNLSRLFRLAEAQHLFTLHAPTLTRQHNFDKKPPREGRPQKNGTYLVYKDWPSDLQEAFTTFYHWATDAVVSGRPASLRKRPATLKGYRAAFEGYFGFLIHIQGYQNVTFDHLFDFDSLTKYVYWHINDIHGKTTKAITLFVTYMLAFTAQYRPLPDLHAQLQTLQKNLPTPAVHYHKEDVWVPLSTIRAVGEQLWPDLKKLTLLSGSRSTGALYAAHAGLSLMLRLWTFIPYRQRNMREMQLGKNLYQDAHGIWRIGFRGDELKVASKQGRTNIFDLPFPPSLVPHLEEYLTHWRPRLLLSTHNTLETTLQHVFLSRVHRTYSVDSLNSLIKRQMYTYTGKALHPHMIRTIWATEHIRAGLNFLDVAKMLNDRIETVIARYTHLLDEDVAEKAFAMTDKLTGQGK